jgi:hypothetical protein
VLAASTLVGVANFSKPAVGSMSAIRVIPLEHIVHEAQRDAHADGKSLADGELAQIKKVVAAVTRMARFVDFAEVWLRAFCFGLVGCLIGEKTRERARSRAAAQPTESS